MFTQPARYLPKGIQYGKHSVVQSTVHRDLVKPGIIPKDLGALYDRMFNARQEGDYKAFTEFSAEDVTTELIEVERFIQQFHTLLAEEKAR